MAIIKRCTFPNNLFSIVCTKCIWTTGQHGHKNLIIPFIHKNHWPESNFHKFNLKFTSRGHIASGLLCRQSQSWYNWCQNWIFHSKNKGLFRYILSLTFYILDISLCCKAAIFSPQWKSPLGYEMIGMPQGPRVAMANINHLWTVLYSTNFSIYIMGLVDEILPYVRQGFLSNSVNAMAGNVQMMHGATMVLT